MSKKVSVETVSLPSLLFLLFLGLKLANIGVVASWSWWWVTAPLWIPASLVISVWLVVIAVMLIVYLVKR